MLLDPSFFNTQHNKVRIKGKVEQSRENELRPSQHLGVIAIKTRSFGSPSTTVAKFNFLYK